MDDIDRHLLRHLQDDARTSLAELGRRVGLSSPAVAERVRRLESIGVISGYHAHIDLKQAGFGIIAFIRLTSAPELAAELGRIAATTNEVLEFHHVTGTEGYIIKVAVRSIEHLEKVIVAFLPFGQTTTSIVLSSPTTWRRVEFAED